MITVLLTGGIGSGKSVVAAVLKKRGVPVWDSDSAAKSLYTPAFLDTIEKEFGRSFRTPEGVLDRKALSALIFKDDDARERLESLLYPALMREFLCWRAAYSHLPMVVMESAVALSKPYFKGLWDAVVLVEASEKERLARVMSRDGASREAVLERMRSQDVHVMADVIICNHQGLQELENATVDAFFGKNSYICKLINRTK